MYTCMLGIVAHLHAASEIRHILQMKSNAFSDVRHNCGQIPVVMKFGLGNRATEQGPIAASQLTCVIISDPTEFRLQVYIKSKLIVYNRMNPPYITCTRIWRIGPA